VSFSGRRGPIVNPGRTASPIPRKQQIPPYPLQEGKKVFMWIQEIAQWVLNNYISREEAHFIILPPVWVNPLPFTCCQPAYTGLDTVPTTGGFAKELDLSTDVLPMHTRIDDGTPVAAYSYWGMIISMTTNAPRTPGAPYALLLVDSTIHIPTNGIVQNIGDAPIMGSVVDPVEANLAAAGDIQTMFVEMGPTVNLSGVSVIPPGASVDTTVYFPLLGAFGELGPYLVTGATPVFYNDPQDVRDLLATTEEDYIVADNENVITTFTFEYVE